MIASRSLLAVIAGLVASSHATFYTTNPTARVTWTAGESEVVQWQEDNSAPLVTDFGRTRVDLCTGSATQQACLVNLGTLASPDGADPARTRRFNTTIPASAGPNGQYFIRYMSMDAVDSGGVPLLSFSAQFTIAGLSGPAPNLVDASALAYESPSAPARTRSATASRSSNNDDDDASTTARAARATSAPVAGTSGVNLAVVTSVSSAGNATSGASTLFVSGTSVAFLAALVAYTSL